MSGNRVSRSMLTPYFLTQSVEVLYVAYHVADKVFVLIIKTLKQQAKGQDLTQLRHFEYTTRL